METILATPPPATPTTSLHKLAYRLNSIDLLRGIIMIIMALDHTRDYFHNAAMTDDPLNMQTTTPALFFTRWITHFCAPVFVFLAGTSGFFQSLRKSKKELSRFLISRGFWLIIVEIFIFNFIYSFDPSFISIGLQTLWAIGVSMIFLGLAIWLPFNIILALGLIIVLGHNALDFYEKDQQAFPLWYALVHHVGFYKILGDRNLFLLYPFLPWTGLMFLGYCFGKLFTQYEGDQRRKILTWLGLSIIILFVVLRVINIYGDPRPWQTQKNGLYTFFSFLNNNKYPPSLLYMCMTIGPAILFLAWIGNAKTKLAQIITVYGRVPFFYYVLHFFLIHLLASVFYLLRGHSFAEGIAINQPLQPLFTNPGEGYNLLVVYIVWLSVVASLYPLCKWFSDYKAKHKDWWLSYL
jgi:uncharacterized membrane protein